MWAWWWWGVELYLRYQRWSEKRWGIGRINKRGLLNRCVRERVYIGGSIYTFWNKASERNLPDEIGRVQGGMAVDIKKPSKQQDEPLLTVSQSIDQTVTVCLLYCLAWCETWWCQWHWPACLLIDKTEGDTFHKIVRALWIFIKYLQKCSNIFPKQGWTKSLIGIGMLIKMSDADNANSFPIQISAIQDKGLLVLV